MNEHSKGAILATIDSIELFFAVRFGTYTADDTVKVSEVFEVLKEIKERVEETVK